MNFLLVIESQNSSAKGISDITPPDPGERGDTMSAHGHSGAPSVTGT